MRHRTDGLRVAFVAGTLGQGGAEKQLVSMVGALASAGVAVRVISFSRGEFYEAPLRALGAPPVWVGRARHPVLRLPVIAAALAPFRPQVIQAAHGFVNLYAALLAGVLGGVSVGAMRNSLKLSQAASGRWTRALVTAPHALLANSQIVVDEIVASGMLGPERIWFLPNAIDLEQFDRYPPTRASDRPTAIMVGRLIALKRVDTFLRALAKARLRNRALRGVVAGDGPERSALERLAAELGLSHEHLTFLGARSDVPSLLGGADMLVLASDDEGTPNVVLEAMAARLPVISTPAGDAKRLVEDGVNGYLVPFGDADAISERMLTLAESRALRGTLGGAGRRHVERFYSADGLAERLLSIYGAVATQQGHGRLRRALSLCQASCSARDQAAAEDGRRATCP